MERICCKCKVKKELSSENFTKDKNDITGFTYSCKICRKEQYRIYRLNNPDKVKSTNQKSLVKRKEYYNTPERKLHYRKKFIERKFKITYADYEEMQTKQNNKCAICGLEESHIDKNYLSVDHNHISGAVRGLLCSRCNFGLGYFKDSIENLKNAIIYLNKSEI